MKGDPIPEGAEVQVQNGEPIFFVGKVLEYLKVPRSLTRKPDYEDGVIHIQFQGLP
jgi:hypothetical protein